jgi:hypothetical protein
MWAIKFRRVCHNIWQGAASALVVVHFCFPDLVDVSEVAF